MAKTKKPPQNRGSGHPNILCISDFGSPELRSFKVETEFTKSTGNHKEFNRLWKLVHIGDRRTKADTSEIVDLCASMVDGVKTDPILGERAKAMFKAAFGL
jgi:hypothetical protein